MTGEKRTSVWILAACLALQLALPACGRVKTPEATGGNLTPAEQGSETIDEKELGARRAKLNAQLSRRGIEVSEQEFAALLSFCGDLGTDWLDGTSALARIVRDREEATRLETARAFGVWCHVSGAVDAALAQRRLDEAALWLDGDTAAATEEFAYFGIAHTEKEIEYITDYAVYRCGEPYEDFPLMVRLGYTMDGYVTADGETIRAGDVVRHSALVRPNWIRNDYEGRRYPDVAEESWYYDYVMELSAAGGLYDRGDGSFAPNQRVTTGEALKLILLSAGHAEQEARNGHWAGGYARYALERGYLKQESLQEFDGPITRRDAARLAAGAIGFSQSKNIPTFADTQDGYVAALQEIGVLTGAREDGELRYMPDEEMTRAEIAALVWRMKTALQFGRTQTLVHTNSRGTYPLELLNIQRFSYLRDSFSGEGRELTYEEPGVTVLHGIDVSRFQGEIDWEAAAADGIDFAMLRVGGRYFASGEFYDDSMFERNFAAAREAGVRLGVYFFSQAITPEEAVQEADFVLEKLSGAPLELPVVFDWELTGNARARTNGLSTETVTDCASAFCRRIRAAGYRPMVYFTKYQGYIKYDLARLTDADFWYADDYEGEMPLFFYDFQMWQYSTHGRVAGIKGNVDLDLLFLRG